MVRTVRAGLSREPGTWNSIWSPTWVQRPHRCSVAQLCKATGRELSQKRALSLEPTSQGASSQDRGRFSQVLSEVNTVTAGTRVSAFSCSWDRTAEAEAGAFRKPGATWSHSWNTVRHLKGICFELEGDFISVANTSCSWSDCYTLCTQWYILLKLLQRSLHLLGTCAEYLPV